MNFTEQLKDLGACKDAVEWVNGRSLRKCWQVADRADWMLWLADELGIDRRLRVMAACACAETAQKYADDGGISANTLKVALDWCEGRATIAEVRKAADDAAEAAEAHAADAAHYAAYAACMAADFADADYDADHDVRACEAVEAAAHVVAHAASAHIAAYAAAQKKMAKLVRKRIPVEVIEKALQETEI